ncbi:MULTISPECIES: hypothetical protein [Paenibacillus]|uniref:Uncharacterized protein n=1 Tax=Paenibacillus macerans TaxID=44252 RepID=A0A6N8EPV5_PAEMA|nr:hypothetical protein [Paenibacillus macerans]MUG22346.1 hypothetical protein [Paenibacillus macerans]UMV49110.1 hypothetical protein LMZ02_07055 [Paenibacillus macerans]
MNEELIKMPACFSGGTGLRAISQSEESGDFAKSGGLRIAGELWVVEIARRRGVTEGFSP